MNYFKLFLMCLLFQNLIVNALYLKRMQRSTQKFTKKHIFRPLSRLNKRFFTYFFSPKINPPSLKLWRTREKSIYKKPQLLKNVTLNQRKNILQKKQLNLKTSIKRYYQSNGAYKKVKDSLSFKYAQKKSLSELKDFFEKITHYTIADMDFAMKEVTQALEREQIAQEEKKFVGYHSMPTAIFLMLNVYTKLYDKVHNKITPKDFIYLRTFEDISDQTELNTFLENHLSNPFKFNDTRDPVGRKHLLSLCPFLFQKEPEESALNRNPLATDVLAIMRTILTDILSNLGLTSLSFSAKSIAQALGSLETLGRRNMVIQFVFRENENYKLNALEENKLALPGESKDMYVGYDENHIFPNLYWSGVDGIPCFKRYPKYKGSEILENTLAGAYFPDADIAQLRLLITPEYLKQKKYRIHIVDINNQFQDFEQKVNELTDLILKEVAVQKTSNSSIIKD